MYSEHNKSEYISIFKLVQISSGLTVIGLKPQAVYSKVFVTCLATTF